MAELAASAFAAAASSAAAGSAAAAGSIGSWLAGTTVTTAAGVTSALAPASGMLSALQGAATITSMASTLLGGAMAYRQSQDQAMFADLDAEGARLESEERALRIRRETVQKIGAARVAGAASGLDLSSTGAIEGAIGDDAEYQIGAALDAGAYQTAKARANSSQIRTRGSASLATSAARALGTGLDYGISIARRG